LLFESHERLHVHGSAAAERDRHIVAAVLAFLADLVRNPPHGWMVEERDFDDRLCGIGQPVVTLDVRQRVREDQLD
jgi:hypothetical protein